HVADSALTGTVFSQTFEYSPLSSVKRENLSFVALVQEYDETDVFRRRVYNARSARIIGDSLVVARDDAPPVRVRVYPNPFDDAIQIQSSRPVEQLLVFDREGKIVFCGASSVRVDLSHLPSGVYLMEIRLVGGQSFRTRAIKR
ncbi:MAG: T9SS type A sorting domain-containing protein, partial [Bacteroidia bacterium]|nr:T9SS type A sorting domain-containing protein [Bacteroidia bacterium]